MTRLPANLTNHRESSPRLLRTVLPGCPVSWENGPDFSSSSFSLISSVHHAPQRYLDRTPMSFKQQPPEDHSCCENNVTRSRAPRSARITGLTIDRSITGSPGSPSSQRLLLCVACVRGFRLSLSLSLFLTRALITHPSPPLPATTRHDDGRRRRRR